MNQFTAPFYDERPSLSDIRQQTKWTLLDCGWTTHTTPPQVEVAIAASPAGLLVHFKIAEPEVRAEHAEINSAVYEDSCVELFICFGDEEKYYNIEMNCLGTVLAGYGAGREGRSIILSELLQQIEVSCQIASQDKNGLHHWELTAFVPVSVFCHHDLRIDEDFCCHLNFYKCGDKLKEPHFYSWQPVAGPTPNFHQRAAFTAVIFSRAYQVVLS